MQFHNLKRKTKNKKVMVVGRGGKHGKTSGRGTKGQNSRAGRKKRPEMRDMIKTIPKLRGRGVNSLKTIQTRDKAINLGALDAMLSKGDIVTPAFLVEKGVIATFNGKTPSVKILSMGEITKAVTVSGCAVSAGAKAKIEAVGGSVK